MKQLQNHFTAILYTLAYLWVVAFALPLPGDRGLMLNHFFPLEEEAEYVGEVVELPPPLIEEIVKEEVIVETGMEEAEVKDKYFVDSRKLYVEAIKKVYKVDFPYELADHLERVALKEGVDRDLTYAVIAAESSFIPTASSSVGAVGYMQVWPRWHKERIGDRDIWDPKTNIEVGVNYLAELLDMFDGDVYEALAYYNGAKTREAKDRYVNKVTHRSELLVSAMNL